MLRLEGVDAFYGDLQALFGISLEVREGEILALVGAERGGQDHVPPRTMSGLHEPAARRVTFAGEDLAAVAAHRRVDLGIVQVPEGRRLFPSLTVAENLLLGAHTSAGAGRAGGDAPLCLRPLPRARGAPGPARGLALGRRAADVRHRPRAHGPAAPRSCWTSRPWGWPRYWWRASSETVKRINADGVTVLLVEQNVRQALGLANRACVLESGHLVLSGPAQTLLGDERLRARLSRALTGLSGAASACPISWPPVTPR